MIGNISVIRCLVVACLALVSGGTYAVTDGDLAENLMPDVFSDPLLGTPYGVMDRTASIDIDTFSGMLSVRIPVVSLPLHGGRSLSLSLSYHSSTIDSTSLPSYSPIGVGWSMHMGHVALRQPLKMCNRSYNAHTLDNPVFISPDGSSHLLVMASDEVHQSYDVTYFSASGHALFCNTDNSFYVMAPDGTRYDLGEFSAATGTTPAKWHVTRITDTNDNEVLVEYANAGFDEGQGKVISSIKIDNQDSMISLPGSYDVELVFSYSSAAGDALLSSVSVPGGSWSFSYQSASLPGSTGHAFLTGITDPEGNDWSAAYWPYADDGLNGSASLKEFGNPFGGRHNFSYDEVVFNPSLPTHTTNSIKRYEVFQGGVTGIWDYTYETGIQGMIDNVVTDDFTVNRTRVSGPDGDDIYDHVGMYQITNDNVWLVGSLVRRQFLANSANTRTETYLWERNILSGENYLRPQDTTAGVNIVPWDAQYGVPRLLKKRVSIGSASFVTEYQGYTSTGLPIPSLPVRIKEITSSPAYSGSRVVEMGYWSNPDSWIWFLPSGTAFDGNSQVFEGTGYDDSGNAVFSYAQGEETYRTLGVNGNIASEVKGPNPGIDCSLCPPVSNDAKAPVFYSDYHAGVPRRVDFPDGGFLDRQVNDYGQVLAETNALSHTHPPMNTTPLAE